MNELLQQARELCDEEFNAGKIGATMMRKIYTLCDALETEKKRADQAALNYQQKCRDIAVFVK